MPMERPTTSAEAESAYDSVADVLEERFGAQQGKMMGMLSLKHEGKMLAGLWGDAMVFKLIDESHAEALALDRSHLFDPRVWDGR